MTTSRREAMTQCPCCDTMTSDVLTCAKCGDEGCKNPDCIMVAGKSKACTNCRAEMIDSGELLNDDSRFGQALSDDDEDDD